MSNMSDVPGTVFAPFFAVFDRICSLFRRFRSDEVYPYVMALFRLGYTIQAFE